MCDVIVHGESAEATAAGPVTRFRNGTRLSRVERVPSKSNAATTTVDGVGGVVGVGGGLGTIPTSRERGPSVTLTVVVLAF